MYRQSTTDVEREERRSHEAGEGRRGVGEKEREREDRVE